MEMKMRSGVYLLLLLGCGFGSLCPEVKFKTTTEADVWLELNGLRLNLQLIGAKMEKVEKENADLRAELNANNVQLNANSVLLNATETELQLQKKKLEDLERENTAQVSSLRDRLTHTEREGEELRQEAAALRAELNATNTNLNANNVQLNANNVQLNATETELQLQKKKLEDLERENTDTHSNRTSQQVAFSASLGDLGTSGPVTGPYSDERTLIYSNIFTNSGHYSSTTGIFTAPVRGVYFFRFTAFNYNSDRFVGVYLYRNNEWLTFNDEPASNSGSDLYTYVSNGLVLELQPGDRVYMKLRTEMTIYDNFFNRCTFSGFLIYTL